MGYLELQNARRRTIRAPQNPLDKSTIVSIYPREVFEVKHTIQPGRFLIPAGSYEKPSILVVGSSSWWREIDEEQPLLEIPNSSIQVADSIVNDYCRGLIACNMSTAMPGLFYIPGEKTVAQVQKDDHSFLTRAKIKQDQWYMELVKMTDTLWSRTNGNPLVVSDDARLAAKELALTNKDWMMDFQAVQNVRCTACGSLRNPLYPICPTCKSVDQTHPSAKDLKFAV
jgi:hypothetical protein